MENNNPDMYQPIPNQPNYGYPNDMQNHQYPQNPYPQQY